MKTLAARRNRNLIIVTGVMLLFLVISALNTTALRDTARLSGWLLLVMIAFLAAYNLRKKVPFLPLGSASSWLQFHIYAGLLTAVMFATHIAWRVPRGPFEIVLAALYVSVFGSGVAGLFLSRSFAKRLTTRGNEVMFERIPFYRQRMQREVESFVLSFLRESESSAVAQFYADRLEPFFANTRHFWQHLAQSNRPCVALLNEMSSYERFLNQRECEAMRQLASHVEKKNELDYQFALQATLKYWLFGHVPLTYALLVFAVFHLLLVSAFSGGSR